MTSFVGLAPLEIEHAPVHVLGFPFHVALVVRYQVDGIDEPGCAYDVVVTEAPRLDLLAPPSCVGVELVSRATGERVVHRAPVIPIEADDDSSFEHAPNGARRVLLDLAEKLPADLAAGEYLLTLEYAADGEESRSAPRPLEIRAPSLAESEFLEAEGGPEPGRSWREWVLDPTSPLLAPGTPSADDPARFERILHVLIHGPESLAAIDLGLYDSLDGLLAPEARALREEACAARAADRRGPADRLRADYPELGWWADEIASGTSRIPALRELFWRPAPAG